MTTIDPVPVYCPAIEAISGLSFAISALPKHMRQGVVDWVLRACPVGGFLAAVLSDSLITAAGRADMKNAPHLAAWGGLLNALPYGAWGSPSTVAAWRGLNHEATRITITARREPEDGDCQRYTYTAVVDGIEHCLAFAGLGGEATEYEVERRARELFGSGVEMEWRS